MGESSLRDLLLDPESVPARVSEHVVGCSRCTRELDELRSTMDLLDGWAAPEPSPYFLTRLDARLEEERRAPAAGWRERLRARLSYGAHPFHVRPLAATALTAVLLLGGGTYLGMTNWDQPAAPPPQAVVHDLQVLDNNAQLLDQMEDISGSDGAQNQGH